MAWGVETGGEWRWRGEKRKRDKVHLTARHDTTGLGSSSSSMIYILCFVFSIHNSWTSFVSVIFRGRRYFSFLSSSPNNILEFFECGILSIYLDISVSIGIIVVLAPLLGVKHCLLVLAVQGQQMYVLSTCNAANSVVLVFTFTLRPKQKLIYVDIR